MLKLLFCCVLFAGAYAFNHGQDLKDFEQYILDFDKDYGTSATARNNANYYFTYHTKLIAQQNALADRKASTYRVKINQFSDIRLKTFAARLPQAVYPAVSYDSTPVATEDAVAEEFNILTEYDMNVTAQDQGTLCSSSWAYAVAKAVQIMNALPSEMQPEELSAQQLIDCAGLSTACTTQVPQQGFDYLTQQMGTTSLLTEMDYMPTADGLQGMCKSVATPTGDVKVATYALARDDATIKRLVSSSIPVIVEYNPATFGFMHYSSGVYVPPTKATASSSQFLVVVGYGHDVASNLNYWLCLNSFGTRWGEEGFIKIVRSSKQPIAKGGIFPNTLG